jgi:hypothetical protein
MAVLAVVVAVAVLAVVAVVVLVTRPRLAALQLSASWRRPAAQALVIRVSVIVYDVIT